MNMVTFVVKSAFRNKRRTGLTAVSLAVSMVLIVILQTLLLEITQPNNVSDAIPRFVVRHRTSLTLDLPRTYQGKLEQVEGITALTPMDWFGGVWKEDTMENFFPRFAIDPSRYFDVFTEQFPLSPEMLEDFKKTRNGCLIGMKLVTKHGFKLGDTIIIKGDIRPIDLELKIVGFMDGPNSEQLLFQFKYLEELLGGSTRSGTYFCMADSTDRLETLLPAIEKMFKNSDAEVKAETEKAFQLSFVEMLGNIKLFINSLVTVVIFAVLMIAASTMALAIRERTQEVATLKAIGFRQGQVLMLIVGEGFVVSAFGGGLGLVIATLLLPTPQWFLSCGYGLLTAVVIGVPLFTITMILPERGKTPFKEKLANVRAFIAQYGLKFVFTIGLIVTLMMLIFLPAKDWFTLSGGSVQGLTVRPETTQFGILVTIAIGLFSSLWPAWQASRMSVLDGLRSID